MRFFSSKTNDSFMRVFHYEICKEYFISPEYADDRITRQVKFGQTSRQRNLRG